MTLERAGRAAVALGLAMAWLSLGRVTRVDGLPYAPGVLAALPMNTMIAGVATLLFAAAGGAWLTERHEDAAAVALIGLLAAGAQTLAWQSSPGMGASGSTMLPGAALLAWWAARRFAGTPAASSERCIEAACGLVAACYLVAVTSKLYTSGLGWASPGNIGLQIATQGYLVPEPMHSFRLAAAASRPLCAALGVGTLCIEASASLFVLPAARVPVAALLVGMHLGISVLMGLHHYDWMFTALGWALLSEAGRRAG